MFVMLQSWRRFQQKCYEFNASVVLLTLILCDRFSMDFAITVNPFETMNPSSFDHINYDSGEVQTENTKQFDVTTSSGTKEYGKAIASSDNTFTGLPDQENFDFSLKDSIDPALFGGNYGTDKSDTFEDILNIYAFRPALLDFPELHTTRITIVPKGSQKVSRPFSSIADALKKRLKAIYPGTLYCGDGNLARNENEVGLFRETDICCKKHDQCPAFIRAGQEFKGLRNFGHFTRSHCDCDLKFYNCLKRTGSIISNKIGYTYFNILKPPCFRKEYPIVGCKKRVNNRCYVYIVDDEQLPRWQWFGNKSY